MELEGKNEKGLPYSVKLTDNGLVIKEGNISGNNPTSEFISFDEIEEIMFYEGKDNTVDLDIELKITDRIIAVEGIKDNNLVDEFLDFTDKKLSDEPVTNDKSDKSEKCPNCNKNLNKGSVFCSECGYEIKINNKTKICPYCAEEISSRAVKCKHCGEWLDKKAEMVKNKSKAKSSSNIQWHIVLPFSFIIGLSAGFIGIFNITSIVITSIGLFIVGLIVKNPKNGAKNGLVTGAIMYFISFIIFLLYIPSFSLVYFLEILGIISAVVLGIILGAIFGGLGGYLNKK